MKKNQNRWNDTKFTNLRCLTMQQPWVTAIADGLKTIELRSWHVKYRGPIGIHAGKGWHPFFTLKNVENKLATSLVPKEQIIRAEDERGGLIAIADLVDIREYANEQERYPHLDKRRKCSKDVDHHLSPWGERYGWVLENIRRVKFIPLIGSQGLWKWSGEVEWAS